MPALNPNRHSSPPFDPAPPTLTEDEIDDLLYFARAGETADFKETLSAAASSHNRYEVEILAGAIDAHSGNSVLHMAGANGHVEIVEYILSLPSPHTSTTDPAVDETTTTDHLEAPTSSTILARTPPPENAADPLSIAPTISSTSTLADTTIAPATTSSNITPTSPASYIRTLVNLKNTTSQNTALHWSCVNGRLEVVKLLVLRGGADASVLNAAGHDAVYEAEAAGHEGLVAWMLATAEGLDGSVGVIGPLGEGEEENSEVESGEMEGVETEDKKDSNGVNVKTEGGEKVNGKTDEVGKALEGLELESTEAATTIR